MLHKKALWQGLTFVFALLLCICVTVGIILEQFSTNVDSVLGTQSSTIVSDEGDELYGVYTPDDLYVNKDADGNITSGNANAMIKEAISIGEQEGAEGTVLLKNDGTLPLASGSNVTLLGGRSHMPLLGAGMGVKVQGPVITLEDALSRTTTDWTNAQKWEALSIGSAMDEFTFQGAGYNLNPATISYYSTATSGWTYSDNPTDDAGYMTVNEEPAITSTDLGDTSTYNTAIVVLGRSGSEAIDYNKEDNYLQLSTAEKNLITLAENSFNKVILIINSCNPMEIDDYKNDSKISAILNIGFPGAYGMLGVADVLCGTVSPSGGLADINAVTGLSAPAMQNMGDYGFTNYSAKGGDGKFTRSKSHYYIMEAESIYTGYRYYETRYEDSVLYNSQSSAATLTGDKRDAASSSSSSWDYNSEVSYGFGYGLSYTTFTQEIQTSDVKVNDDRANNSITIDIPVKVTNTGKTYSGKSIVQIYGQAPYYLDSNDLTKTSSVEKTSVELLGFGKTQTLAPGGSETVTVTVDLQNIASYDSTANNGNGGYIMDKGDYYFAVGNGAHDALNNIILTKDSNATIENEDVDRSAVDVEKSVYTYTFNPSDGGELDQTTFSTSKAGVTIENQIPYADFNYYEEDAVTYLSRSSWNTTFPTEYKDVTAPSSMLDDLEGYYYTVKTTDDTSSYTWGSTKTSDQFFETTNLDWDDPVWDNILDELTINEAMYLNAYGGPTFPGADSIGLLEATLVENNGNGIVYNLNTQDTQAPWYMDVSSKNSGWNGQVFGSSTLAAQTFNAELSLRRGEFVGNESLFMGVSLIWGPGLNTHRSIYNGRNCEYYSEDPILCGVIAEYFAYGCGEYGLLSAPKHFAFNDQETNRQGVAPFMTEQRAREIELRAYQIAIECPHMDELNSLAAAYGINDYVYNGMYGVMTSFSKIGAVECTCSRGLLTGILRDEWGFHGYTVTDIYDDTELYNCCVYAGITGYDIRGAQNFDTTSALGTSSNVTDASQRDKTTLDSNTYSGDATMMASLKTNVKNLLWGFAHTNLMNRYSASSHVVSLMTWWRALYISLEVIFAVLTAAGVAMYIVSNVLKKKEAK